MRRTVPVALAVCALVAGLAPVASTAAPTPRARVIKIYTALAQAALLDLGQPGFSVGDEDIFSDNVFTKKNGAKLGIDGGVCTVVRVSDAASRSGTEQCLITFSLKGGQITTQVLQPSGQSTGTATGAITGGTGRYRGAHGIDLVRYDSPVATSVTFSMS